MAEGKHQHPVGLSDVQRAAEKIQSRIHRTPVTTSQTADKLATEALNFPVQLVFKCENLQKIGSFKTRGASNAVLRLLEENPDLTPSTLTVITHSSGNHGQALAYAAHSAGIRCCVIMSEAAPPCKIDAVRGYGGVVTLCEPVVTAREQTMNRVIKEEEAAHPERRVIYVPSSNDPRIVAGQGTLAIEFFEQAEEVGKPLDVIVTPISGGGMLTGCALVAKGLKPGTKVVGAEPAGSGDAYQGFKTKTWVPSVDPHTICDGLLTSTGDVTFPLILDYVDSICMASDEEISRAMKFTWERMKLIIEPSSAVPLAVVLYSSEFREEATKWAAEKGGKLNIGIVLSGGNVKFETSLKIISSV